jgi:NADH:ubiquinone oxidoreductase subunit E
MSSFQKPISEFSLVGQLLGFVIKDGYKIKYLRINFAQQEYWIKPEKNIREQLVQTLTPGCWLEVKGIRKQSLKTGKVKLSASQVDRLPISDASELPKTFVDRPQVKKSNTAKANILVCQKSNCWKRGGKEVCQLLEENIRESGLEDKVQVKLTGCLKQCKQGPNVVVMPDKARYCKVQPHQVTELLEHFDRDRVCEPQKEAIRV